MGGPCGGAGVFWSSDTESRKDNMGLFMRLGLGPAEVGLSTLAGDRQVL